MRVAWGKFFVRIQLQDDFLCVLDRLVIKSREKEDRKRGF